VLIGASLPSAVSAASQPTPAAPAETSLADLVQRAGEYVVEYGRAFALAVRETVS